jgi:Xaa-Pro aminopeptidase
MDTVIASRAAVRERVAALRAEMTAQGWFAVVVPSSDPHLSEYLPARWKSREWLSGFTGSVGTLIVTTDEAALFADSRYWSAAEQELAGSGIMLEKLPAVVSSLHLQWLAARLAPGKRVAVDGTVLGLAAYRALQAAVQGAGGTLVSTKDPVAAIWADRPALPTAPVVEHGAPQAPLAREAKLAATRAAMRAAGADWHLISTLDDIGYLLNLRGSDVPFNPVFLAHLLIGPQGATLFADTGKFSAATRAALQSASVALAAYESLPAALASVPVGTAMLVDPKRVTAGILAHLPQGVRIVEAVNPTTLAKSRKTADEARFIRSTMEQDGAALAEFFAGLEASLAAGERITELDIDTRITAARAKRPGFVCPSFSTIAGFRANGALPHYRATDDAHAVIEGDGLLLIDSGGQYLGGTTDITRMVPIGTLTDAQRRDCTLVLKGMMALSRTAFPRGTLSPMLDAIARAPIWAEHIDYGHGTGHGVGYFMNVHEGPQSISRTIPDAAMAMEPGMISSIEPGIYREGHWGVRIENLVLNVPTETTPFGEFLAFETLTLCPIDTRCIDTSLLREDERDWLNDYHAMVRARISPHVSGAALDWLQVRTERV